MSAVGTVDTPPRIGSARLSCVRRLRLSATRLKARLMSVRGCVAEPLMIAITPPRTAMRKRLNAMSTKRRPSKGRRVELKRPRTDIARPSIGSGPCLTNDLDRAAADRRAFNCGENASDRAHAAADRQAAIAERADADRDYRLRRADLRRAQLDQLTGAFGREMGLLLLEREINRARHGNGDLILAYIDVDGLKRVNDRQVHAAGDALLRDVAAAVQKYLRSYDTLVRVGGDEFVCALGNCTRATADSRFEEIRATMRTTQPHASFSVGFAELRAGDTLDELTQRGDAALYAAKRGRRRG
jgi:diguanylate cyclase (GGDEF)-like protein